VGFIVVGGVVLVAWGLWVLGLCCLCVRVFFSCLGWRFSDLLVDVLIYVFFLFCCEWVVLDGGLVFTLGLFLYLLFVVFCLDCCCFVVVVWLIMRWVGD